MRLHCFAHSVEGVSAFGNWAGSVGPGVELVPVLLPGSTGRGDEPRVTTREALLADLLPRFADPHAGPYVLYGQGLGAMVAFTLARALQEAGLPGPELLAVGACRPPHAPSGLSDTRGTTDDELLSILDGGGTVPPNSDEGIWLRAMLPELRVDLELTQALEESAREPSLAGPLTTPMLVIASQSNSPAPPEIVDGWRHWTDGPARLRVVPGHYFFAGGRELPRLLGRACRVAHRLVRQSVPVG
ncbi:thioesterase domain-containing protein (plasmid) [Streptomyces xanthophaeus]|uniref:thioesterase II family protein n=1 Tax=Streptomyces xanthophaeus TaxID=67385 RepID=UPI00386EE7E6|nr:thioesterase domain-containing protein [Streptomyces xanthophaeus]WST65916.1 thioesterase domain-containing protein [Streptomyces xanthophaeus]